MNNQNHPQSVNLSTDVLLQAAIDSTGLTDFGDESFRTPFDILVKALNQEAALNNAGRVMHYQRIVNILENRLRMELWIKLYPEILEESICPPVVIVGLTRTGTTTLHRLLANERNFFAPLWYEVRNPAPFMSWKPEEEDKRIALARDEVNAMLTANPQLAAIHPLDPLAADEEILLLEHSFYSYVPNSFANVPSYGQWVASHDNTPAYTYLKRQLQFLQWQKKCRGESAQRWLLKAPHHLHFMDLLLSVFPEVQVVATHRDPVVSIPSTASFHYNLWTLGSDCVDKHVVAQQWAQLFANGMKHTLGVRERCEKRFFDVRFEDTVSRPLALIKGIYTFLSMEFTQESHDAMALYRGSHPRTDRPTHEYTLEEYGLTESGIRHLFADYCYRFIENSPEL